MSTSQRPCIPNRLPIEDLDWGDLVEPISQAERALGRFDGTLTTMLNPGVLLHPLMMNEAVLSSRIEGTQVSLTEALQHDTGIPQDDSKSSDLLEVLNYSWALQDAEQSLDENNQTITFPLIRAMHERLMRNVRGGDKTPGAFRIKQNWIGKMGDPIEKARFIPPAPTIMHEYLENWGRVFQQ